MSKDLIHFRPNEKNESACGIESPESAAYDARDCNCSECIKTEAYWNYCDPKQPGTVAGEILISSEYDAEEDTLHVHARATASTLMDQFTRMNLMDVMFRSVVEKLAIEFCENFGAEVLGQLDPEVIKVAIESSVKEKWVKTFDDAVSALAQAAESENQDPMM